jgi:hypothetical protein
MCTREFSVGDIVRYRISTERDPHDRRVIVCRELVGEVIRVTPKRVSIKLIDFPRSERARVVKPDRLW